MYDTILLPTDGSDGAEAALAHAKDHAERYGAELHVLFVANAPSHSGMENVDHGYESTDMVGDQHGDQRAGMVDPEGDYLEQLEAEGETVVRRVSEDLGDEVPVTTAVRRGDPYQSILRYADEADADLVVMGTHGRTGLDRYLLGSVTEKVVRTADAPVLTVRLGAAE